MQNNNVNMYKAINQYNNYSNNENMYKAVNQYNNYSNIMKICIKQLQMRLYNLQFTYIYVYCHLYICKYLYYFYMIMYKVLNNIIIIVSTYFRLFSR